MTNTEALDVMLGRTAEYFADEMPVADFRTKLGEAALEYARACGWMPAREATPLALRTLEDIARERGERVKELERELAGQTVEAKRVSELEGVLRGVCDQLTAALLSKRWEDARQHVDKACEILRRGAP